MKKIVMALAFLALAWSPPLKAVDPAVEMLNLGPISVNKKADIFATDKKDYVHVVMDLLPYKAAIATAGDSAKPAALAQALVEKFLKVKYPKKNLYKIVLLEFLFRDSYGSPSWDKVNILARFEARRKGKAFELKAVKNEPNKA
jgi:hypothetical protein